MNSAPAIPIEIGQFLAQVVMRRRRVALLRSLAIAITFAILWMLLWAVVDRLAALPPSARIAIDIVNVLTIAALLARPLVKLLMRRFDWRAAAALVESRRPEFGQRLLTVTS